ncbi:restriction endonuclease [Brevibacillus agri]|uniref:restriction endonuclease n=1 Tax=Brevibacillus agri TaxID=51101 RepID=UPI0018CEA5A5|nr:restriction endonuclease [Brevibacillus agri]MBG9568487.1 hypothetical protein [Brevibacillus agri]
MGKRRREKGDPIAELLGAVVLFVFLGVFWYTQSFEMAGITAGIVLGIIISFSIYRSGKRVEKLKRSGISDIDQMDGRQFEHYLGLLFKSQGYKVDVTRSTGDFGADLVIQKEGKRIVVQAKRHSKNVGISAVQEAQAAIAHYKAHEAWVVSNRGYTEPAVKLAAANSVRLVDREALIEMILQMNPDAIPSAEQVRREVPRAKEKCKVCGKEMVVRRGSKGEFLGCTGYPECRNTKSLTS